MRFQKDPPSALDRDAFLARYGGVYEETPWIAAAAWDAGAAADDVDGLSAAMRRAVGEADDGARLALLRAHPDLAGKLALAGALTAESTAEQASAGLDHCSADELQAFQTLNARYGVKFGFPFIVAVRGLSRAEILDQFRARVENDAATEFATALEQVHKIARLRLEALASEVA